MLYLVTAALAGGLAVALFRLHRHRQVARSLEQAILQRQLVLRENVEGDDICSRLARATDELISEINRLQHLRTGQLAQLEATLGSLQEAVLIVDANNYILLANKALQAIFPSAQNILRQRLELVLRSVAFLNYVDAVRAGAAEPQHEIEFVEGNSSTWVEITGTLTPPLDDQRGPWALFVLHDITKQKKLESVRKDFVANVSHELRTPLSIIKGYIETLVDSRDMPTDDRERFLRTIQRHTERLNSLLEDLLALSRLESINPDLRREPTSLSALIAGLVDDYRARPIAAEHILNFSLDAAVGEMLLDPLKITQVFNNLVENALKYAPRGSHIDISTRRQADGVEVCVRDNGPGIPEADLPHIFERFYRVDKGRSREKGGTGLGLSIVKHIVQLHGGRVRCESKLGQGTAFFFSLPLRVDEAEAQPERADGAAKR
jgi:two-component system phosphate regulon sensor histidine kinase PhoR